MLQFAKVVCSFFLACLFLTCNKNQESISPSPLETRFQIIGNEIQDFGVPIHLDGVNALHTFGLEDLSTMNEWGVEIVREFIGNLREQPIAGAPQLGADGKWLHPLQSIVDTNRVNQKVTIFCPFGWVDEQGDRLLFTGLNPTEQVFYEAYKTKMQRIAQQFRDQPDVWIEVWNEPYHWNNENGYSHQRWLSDQQEMVDNLRAVAGFDNIIVVPGNEQGQGMEAIIENGDQLLVDRYNILFDLHAYEKWLKGSDQTVIATRIKQMQQKRFAFIFGEVGVQNVEDLMTADHFLAATDAYNISTLAWVWSRNNDDLNALLTNDGQPNNLNNGAWGATFKNFLD